MTKAVRQEIKDGFTKGMTGTGTQAGTQFDKEIQPEIDKTGEKIKTKLKTKMGQAGDDSGKAFAARFSTRLKKAGGGFGGILKLGMNKAGDDAGRSFASKFTNSVESHFRNASVKTKLLGGVTSFIGPLLATVGQLSGGLFALGSAIGQSAGALPVLYGGLLSIVSAASAAKLGLSGVSGALGVLNNTKSTPAEIAAAMDGLSPPAKAFVKQLHAMQPALQKIKDTAAKNLLPGLSAGLKAVQPLLPAFRKEVGQLNKEVGGVGKSLGKLLGGPMKHDVQTIFNNNTKVVHNLAGAVTPLVAGILRLYKAMQPVIIEFSHAAKAEAELFAQTTKLSSANGSLTAYFQRSYDRASQLGGILHNIASIILNVGHAASQAGGEMLTSIDDATAHLAQLTGTAKSQRGLAAYFENTIPVLHEVGGIIGDILKDLVDLGGNGDLLPLLQQIRGQLVPALNEVLKATTGPVAHDMVQFLSDLAHGFAIIAGGGSTGYLSSFIRSIDLMVKGLDELLSIPGIGHFIGIIGGLSGAIAAFGLVLGKLRILSFIKNLIGFGGAAKTAAKGVGGLAIAKGAERDVMLANDAAVGKNVASYGRFGGVIDKIKGKLRGVAPIAEGAVGGEVAGQLALAGTGEAAGVGAGAGVAGGLGALGTGSALLGPIALLTASIGALVVIERGKATGTPAENRAKASTVVATGVGRGGGLGVGAVAQNRPGTPGGIAAFQANNFGLSPEELAVGLAKANKGISFMSSLIKLSLSPAIHQVKIDFSSLGTVAEHVGSTSLKGNSAAAKANRQELTAAAGSIKEYRRQMLSTGAPLKEVNQKTAEYTQKLRQNAVDVYGNSKALNNLLKSLGLTVPQVNQMNQAQQNAAANLRQYRDGLVAAGEPLAIIRQRVQDYAGQLHHVPPSVVTKIVANTSVANAQLRQLGTQLGQLAGKTWNVVVNTITHGGAPNPPGKGNAGGGWIKGPGTNTSDSILARLSNNEFVVNAKQAIKHSRLLEHINAGMPGFASGGRVSAGINTPLFTQEGPKWYHAAYKHNRPFATDGPSHWGWPYQTGLTRHLSDLFNQWVRDKKVPFDPSAKIVDYDMRGYWRKTRGRGWGGHGQHFTDEFKTPYDTTFSHESRYATRNNPFFWHGKRLIDERNQQVVFAALGGMIRGKGSGTSDSITARVSNNEFVVRAKQAIKHRRLLEQINSGAPGFAAGGSVSTTISSGVSSRQSNLQSALSGLTQAFVQAIDTSVKAVGRESSSLLQSLHKKVDALEAFYKHHNLDSKLSSLQTSAKQGFADFKIENRSLNALAVERTALVKRLTDAQKTLDKLRQERSALIGSIKTGIGSYSDVTQIVPQGVAVTASRLDINLKYRLSMVKKWAANIKTLIKRGLNKITLQDVINQGPDTGGPYAQALVDATKQQISSINNTESQITTISRTLAKHTGDAFYKSGIAAAKGLDDGLKSQIKDLNQTARNLGHAIASELKQELGIHSPSKVAFEIGSNIPHAVSLGIHAAIPLAENAAAKMAARVTAASSPNRLGMLPMMTQGGGGAPPSALPSIHVEHLHVRDESDVAKVARDLYSLQVNADRAAGRATLPATTGRPV